MNRLISIGEVRLAFRLIVKQPILSATIILALATGICFATMGFTFWDELVNSALPYQAGERFARLYVLNRDGGRVDLDLERYHAFRDRADDARARRRRRRASVHRDCTVLATSNPFTAPRSRRDRCAGSMPFPSPAAP